MNFFEIAAIGLGLSMDALAVSIANGFMIKDLKMSHVLRIAIAFGLFQAIMPVLGWAAGITFSATISAFDHWIAFALLGFIGGKMIWEGLRKKPEGCEDEPNGKNCLHTPTLLLMSLATSLDALAVGLSFAFLNVGIIVPVLIIGGITLVICALGVWLGKQVGHLLEDKLDLIGGIVLVGIGAKILIEHLMTA